jgi:hypothetical protein
LKCQRNHKVPAILFASDTQETSRGQKRAVNKIASLTPKGLPPIFVAGSGDGYLIDEFVYDFQDQVQDLIRESTAAKNKLERRVPEVTSVLLWEARKGIGDLAYGILNKYAQRIGDKADHYFEVLIGTSDAVTRKTELLFVDAFGHFKRVDEFEAVGSGADRGGRLLLQQLYSPNMNTVQAARLAAFVIEQVGNVDAYVSGLQTMKLTYLGKADDFEEKHDKIVTEARSRFEEFKRSWEMTQEAGDNRLRR